MKNERRAPAPGNNHQSRRDFLKRAARIGLAGALAALGSALFRGRGIGAPHRAQGAPGTGPAGFTCTGKDYCRACARASGCGLPQVLSYRRNFGG